MLNIVDTWRHKRALRRTHQRLYQLSDQILADIGLTRADIASITLDARSHRRQGHR